LQSRLLQVFKIQPETYVTRYLPAYLNSAMAVPLALKNEQTLYITRQYKDTLQKR